MELLDSLYVWLFGIIIPFSILFLGAATGYTISYLYYLIIFIGINLFIFGLYLFKKKRLIEDIPTSKIRSIAMGLVEIFGEVVPIKDKILKSPFTKKDCVYYKYFIEELRMKGKSLEWVPIKIGEDRTLFYLQDGTGSVLVDPKGANIEVSPSFSFESGMGKDPPEEVRRFLLENKINFEDFFGINKSMKFTEYCIPIKSRLYIIGTAGDNPFVKEGWAQEGTEDVMIQKGENIYFISNKSEKEILKNLKFQSIVFLFIGSILIIAGVYLLFFLV